jgi:hypothetical protein
MYICRLENATRQATMAAGAAGFAVHEHKTVFVDVPLFFQAIVLKARLFSVPLRRARAACAALLGRCRRQAGSVIASRTGFSVAVAGHHAAAAERVRRHAARRGGNVSVLLVDGRQGIGSRPSTGQQAGCVRRRRARPRRCCASRGTFRAGLACSAVRAVMTNRAATRMGKVVYVSHNLAQDTMLETFLQKELIAWLKAVGLIAAPPGR